MRMGMTQAKSLLWWILFWTLKWLWNLTSNQLIEEDMNLLRLIINLAPHRWIKQTRVRSGQTIIKTQYPSTFNARSQRTQIKTSICWRIPKRPKRRLVTPIPLKSRRRSAHTKLQLKFKQSNRSKLRLKQSNRSSLQLKTRTRIQRKIVSSHLRSSLAKESGPLRLSLCVWMLRV